MSAALAHRVAFLTTSVLVTVLVSGCAVGGKSFSMDSNSRVPFFGLELRERKPKSSGPAFSTISRSKSNSPRFDTAVKVGSQGSKMTLNRGGDQFVARSVPEFAAKEAQVARSEPERAPKAAPESAPLSLPLDDLTSKSVPSRVASVGAADFH